MRFIYFRHLLHISLISALASACSTETIHEEHPAVASVESSLTSTFTEDFEDGDLDGFTPSGVYDVAVTFPAGEGKNGTRAMKIVGNKACSGASYIYRIVQRPGERSVVSFSRKMAGSFSDFDVATYVADESYVNVVAGNDQHFIGNASWQLVETHIPTNLTNASRAVTVNIAPSATGSSCANTAGPFTYWIDDIAVKNVTDYATSASVSFSNQSWKPFSLQGSSRDESFVVEKDSVTGSDALKVSEYSSCAGGTLYGVFMQMPSKKLKLAFKIRPTGGSGLGLTAVLRTLQFTKLAAASVSLSTVANSYTAVSISTPNSVSVPTLVRAELDVTQIGGGSGCSPLNPAVSFFIDDLTVSNF